MKAFARRTLPVLMAALVAGAGCEKPAVDNSHFAPEGVYFLKVAARGRQTGKVVDVRAGTMLTRVGENKFQTAQGAELSLTPEYVTNDMRVVRMLEQEERRRVVKVATPAWETSLSRRSSEARGGPGAAKFYTPAPVIFNR